MKKLLYLFVLISSFSYGQPLVIAHRGGAGMAPENTLAAFNMSIEVNADYYELDVMISSDDSLVIMHDATVNRTTDGTGTVSAMTFEQLRDLDAGSWFSAEFAGEKVPTLREALLLAKDSPNDIGVIIEIKTDNATVPAKVVALVQELGMEDDVVVSSFSLSQITEVKSLDPTIAVQLFGSIGEAQIDDVVAINGDWVGSGGTLSQAVIDYAHMQGIYFNAWTLNSASTMEPAIALGVDAITTDYPELMINLLDETEPSDVVLSSAEADETRVLLTWEKALDEESGIAGYDLFRDEAADATTLLASVGSDTFYVDETYSEETQYYYRIKARNNAGLTSLNYSNEISVSTLGDITPPELTSITSRGDSSTVVIGFSERIEQSTAESAANYSLNNGAEVVDAKLALDNRSVILFTTPLSEQSYLLTIKNVTDIALTPNPIEKVSKIFLHHSLPDSVVAFYKLDSLPFSDPDYLVIDESENQNTGIVRGGVFSTAGILGNAIGFDGVDDYVEFQSSESFDINASAVTLSLWTKLPYTPSGLPTAYAPLFDSETDNYVIYSDRGNNELRFKVVTSGGAERPGIPGSDIRTGEWIHVAGVYDGTNAMIYLNGELKDSHSLTGTVKAGQMATLGKTGSVFFEGSIDQVEVYSRALSEEEILAISSGILEAPISRNPGPVVLDVPVVDETSVTLNWSEAVNYESKMMGYEIYRSADPGPEALLATVGDITTYTDEKTEEGQKYYYRVKGKNTLGLYSEEFSNEVSAETGMDLTRPVVRYATSRGDLPGIILEFNEKLDPVSASDIANYSIDQSVTVTGASLTLDQRSVILTTSVLTEGSYIITLNGIKDLAGVPNVILSDTRLIVTHLAESSDLVALYKMNELTFQDPDTLLLDHSKNGNDGQVKNGPEIVDGLLGNGVEFDHEKKQFVQFANSPSFDINDTVVSISVWTKLTYLPVEMPESYGPLFDSQGDQYVIYADKWNKELRFKVATSEKAERPGIPNDDLITGQWINVFAVYDGSTAKIYLNGELKDSHNIGGTVNAGMIPMIGKSGTAGTPAFFNGSIDNVTVFKKAFSAEEIIQMYEDYRMEAVADCETYNITEEVSICSGESYTFPDGTIGTEEMTHVSTLSSVYGCDSIITTHLSYIVVDASVSLDQGVLTATVSDATYRWLDCDNNYTVIEGESARTFEAQVTGNYAVEVSSEGCKDTSECVYVEALGINDRTYAEFNVFPNPNQGQFTLEIRENGNQEYKMEIFNVSGVLVFEERFAGSGTREVDLTSVSRGIYLIRLYSESKIIEKQLVIF